MAGKWKPPLRQPAPARAYLLAAFNDGDTFFHLRKDLAAQFGHIEYETQDYPARQWSSAYGFAYRLLHLMSFERLIKQEELVDFRKRTLLLESRYQVKGIPQVELDPGYVSKYTVVRTALVEDFHRIYLYGGIYGETLFCFERLSFRPYPHTPECFCRKEIISALTDIRTIHLSD